MKKVIRKLGRPVKKLILSVTNLVGSIILRNPLLRRALNNAYENKGYRFSNAVNYLMDEPALRAKAVWNCSLNGRIFKIPMSPSFPRSWSNARYWNWAPAAQPRRFYEWYLNRGEPAAMLDIGANDGMYTYPFAAHKWTSHCFEPQPSCIEYIEETCRLNAYDGVKTVQCLVGETESEGVDFYVSRSSWFSSRKKENVERFEPAELIKMPCLTVDKYCGKNGVKPSFVKIDVEGFELEVLQGATSTLKECLPEMSIEIACDDLSKKRRIWDLLRPLNYRFYRMGEGPGQRPCRVDAVENFLDANKERLIADFILIARPEVAEEFEKTFSV